MLKSPAHDGVGLFLFIFLADWGHRLSPAYLACRASFLSSCAIRSPTSCAYWELWGRAYQLCGLNAFKRLYSVFTGGFLRTLFRIYLQYKILVSRLIILSQSIVLAFLLATRGHKVCDGLLLAVWPILARLYTYKH